MPVHGHLRHQGREAEVFGQVSCEPFLSALVVKEKIVLRFKRFKWNSCPSAAIREAQAGCLSVYPTIFGCVSPFSSRDYGWSLEG